MGHLNPGNLVDRVDEQNDFAGMLDGTRAARLMQICIPSGGGKSSLLRRLQLNCQAQQPPVPVAVVDLEDMLTPFEFARAAYEGLSDDAEDDFTGFGALSAAFEKSDRGTFGFPMPAPPQVEARVIARDLKDTQVQGVVVNNGPVAFTAGEQSQAAKICVQKFMEELQALLAARPAVLMLDTWEKCGQELRKWVTLRLVRDLVARAPGHGGAANLRLVVAGQPHPEAPLGLAEDEFRQWFGPDEAYAASVRVINCLTPFQDEHVVEFMAVHGLPWIGGDNSAVEAFEGLQKAVRHLVFQGNLRSAEEAVKALRPLFIRVGRAGQERTGG